MREKYCLPIIRQQKQEVFEDITRNQADYAFFEVWLDYIEGVDEQFVHELASRYANRVILLFRRLQLEPIRMPLKNRLLLLRAVNLSETFVDLDAASQQAEFNAIASEHLQLRIVGSYHNYQETPAAAALDKIAGGILALHPAIIKISTFCNNDADAVRLLDLQQQLKAQKQRHIVLGMGSQAAVTRIFGTLWGNELVFAPEDISQQTAPGQFTRQQLDAIFQSLH
jgi:3-dehydroquinate dehydratase type I